MIFFTRPKIYLRWLFFILLIIVSSWYFFKIDRHFLTFQYTANQQSEWGITFSRPYAESLGVDWRQAYVALLDDLKIKNIRLPIYWSDIERADGVMDYSDYDWMLAEGEKRGVNFIAVVGRRLPRWPECHVPRWTGSLPEERIRDRELAMVTNTVQHFNNIQAIVSWQAENEYFVNWFGDCPKGDKEFLASVMARIRQVDTQRKIFLTDSGEFSTWSQVAGLSDNIGITMYRVAWNPSLGYTYTPWPAWLYRLKASWNKLAMSNTIVAELQAEPWPTASSSMKDLTVAEIQQSFPLQQLETNAELARRTGFSATYFWGAEWWYLRLLQGDNSYWETAKKIIHQT